MKKVIAVLMLGSVFVLQTSCGENKEQAEKEPATEQQEEAQVEAEEQTPSIYGTYDMTDMIPDAEGKKLTAVDEKYISESKERTIGKTTLVLNEDGTFSRKFPHPSGDGSMSEWKGTFEYNEEAATLNMLAEMNGKQMPINFTIVDRGDEKLNLRTDFGKLFMIYVYSKK